MNLRVGSLFTGYGGLDIAVGGELAWYAEIEPAACKVLANHYPGVPNLGDITKIDWSEVEPVDVITGGYPCQPFSHAGNRKGKNDVRHLWPNVLDAIRAIRPRYAILENVSGHLTLGFADVLADLAEVGLSAQWGTFRASDVGAPHRRERIFIIAHTNGERSQGRIIGAEDAIRPGSRGAASDDCGIIPANTNNSGWLENVEQSSDIAATPGQGQPSVIHGSGADRDAATGSGALVATDTSGDGHGQQLHARGMASVEGQATGSPQQRQRSRRESDAGSIDNAANAADLGWESTSERLWARGSATTSGHQRIATDASGERHGSGERPASVERMGGASKGSGWQASAARQEFGTGSVGDAADTVGEYGQFAEGRFHSELTDSDRKQRNAADTNSSGSETFDGRSRRRDAGRLQLVERGGQVDWGKYGPAIRRWEIVLERAAPAPTTPGRNDRPRLNPQFVEWMMGLPDGWVTGHGLSAAKELKMLGNGVVPQQAHAAIRQLLERTQQ